MQLCIIQSSFWHMFDTHLRSSAKFWLLQGIYVCRFWGPFMPFLNFGSLKKMRFGYFSLGCFRCEFCHLWERFWDGSWCVVNLKYYSFQNVYGYVQEAKISAREAQLPIRSEKHLKLKFWQTSRFLNVFSDFPLVRGVPKKKRPKSQVRFPHSTDWFHVIFNFFQLRSFFIWIKT